jgi:sugar lactone lactonase YvrE
MKRLGGVLLASGLLLSGCGALGGDEPELGTACSEIPGTACNWAGVVGERGFNGDGLPRTESWLGLVADLTFAPDGRAWLVDWNNHRVRRVNDDQTLETMIGTDYEGDGAPGEVDRLPVGDPEGAPGTEVALNHPTDIEFEPDGSVIMAAWHNNKIRRWDAATGIVKVVGGDSYGYAGDDGVAAEAVFNQPKSVVLDEEGRIYTSDQRNQRIRVIDNAEPRMISTIAGNGLKGAAGDDGPALDAEFGWDDNTTPVPNGGLLLHEGMLYVADTGNNRIRRINLETGIIDCIAGTGAAGYSGDGGPALAAELYKPNDLEIGPDGRLYVADMLNNVIRAIDLETGTIERVAGNAQQCPQYLNCFEDQTTGEPVMALDLQLLQPYGIAFDAAGAMYIADTNNSRVVRIAP